MIASLFLSALLLLGRSCTVFAFDDLLMHVSADDGLIQALQHLDLSGQRNLNNNAKTTYKADDDTELQDICSSLISSYELFFYNYTDVEINCDCISDNNVYTLNCYSKKNSCCGEYCGDIYLARTVSISDGDIVPLVYKTCIDYTEGLDEYRCVSTGFCTYLQPCECSLSIDGTECTSCQLCGGNTTSVDTSNYMTYDCRNILGNEDLMLDSCKKDKEFSKLGCPVKTINIEDDTESTASNDDSINGICSVLTPLFESTYQDLIDVPFNCSDCTTENGLTSSYCESTENKCCGQYCGTIGYLNTFAVDNNDVALAQSISCVGYTEGLDEIRCFGLDFCADSSQPCGCRLSIDGKKCQSCEVCGFGSNNADGSIFMTYDCSNIRGHAGLVQDECKVDTAFQPLDCAIDDSGDGTNGSSGNITDDVVDDVDDFIDDIDDDNISNNNKNNNSSSDSASSFSDASTSSNPSLWGLDISGTSSGATGTTSSSASDNASSGASDSNNDSPSAANIDSTTDDVTDDVTDDDDNSDNDTDAGTDKTVRGNANNTTSQLYSNSTSSTTHKAVNGKNDSTSSGSKVGVRGNNSSGGN